MKTKRIAMPRLMIDDTRLGYNLKPKLCPLFIHEILSDQTAGCHLDSQSILIGAQKLQMDLFCGQIPERLRGLMEYHILVGQDYGDMKYGYVMTIPSHGTILIDNMRDYDLFQLEAGLFPLNNATMIIQPQRQRHLATKITNTISIVENFTF